MCCCWVDGPQPGTSPYQGRAANHRGAHGDGTLGGNVAGGRASPSAARQKGRASKGQAAAGKGWAVFRGQRSRTSARSCHVAGTSWPW
jgi:hypothetical protein